MKKMMIVVMAVAMAVAACGKKQAPTEEGKAPAPGM